MTTSIKASIKDLIVASKKLTKDLPKELHNVYRTQGTLIAIDQNEHPIIRSVAATLAIAPKDSITFIPSLVITGYGFLLAKKKKNAVIKRVGVGLVSALYLHKVQPKLASEFLANALDLHTT